MDRNAIVEDKYYGFNLDPSYTTVSSLASQITNNYAVLVGRGKAVDLINFEVHYTNIVATVLETVNPYLKSFKLVLMMEELPASTTVHRSWL